MFRLLRRRGPRVALLLALVLLAPARASVGPRPSLGDAVVITAVTLDGYAISWGDRRILIDALHRAALYGVTPEMETAMREARPPFDADLVLVTHEHIDHFIADVVADNLQSNPKAILVSNPAVVDLVRALVPGLDPTRTVSLTPSVGESVSADVAAVHLEVFNCPHGVPGVLNLGFLLDLGGRLLFHPGDLAGMTADSDAGGPRFFDFRGRMLDIVFVPYWYLRERASRPFVRREWPARFLVPMHNSPKRLGAEFHRLSAAEFPNLVFFADTLGTWTLPEDVRPG